MIYLIVNIIIKDLLTITSNIEVVLGKKSSKTLNKMLEKYLRKSSFFIKVTSSESVVRRCYIKKVL